MHDLLPRARRVLLVGLIAAWTLAVASVTLTSSPYEFAPVRDLRLCLLCDTRGVADMMRNWLLFLPFGMGIAWLRNIRWALGISILLTVGIEAYQQILPGRDPALQDVLANSLGAASGAWLARRATRSQASRALLGLSVLAWLLPIPLLLPAPADGPYYGQLTPRREGFEEYSGQVLEASLGGVEIVSDQLPDADDAGRAFMDRSTLDARVVVGRPPRALSPVVSVVASRERDLLLLGVIGTDLLVRSRSVAGVLQLDQPDARWVDALGDVAPLDTVRIVVERARDSFCMRVDLRQRCRLAPGPGDGWAFLLNLEGGPGLIRLGLAVLWSLSVGAALGLSLETRARAVGASVALATAALGLALVAPDVRPAPAQALLLIAGASLAAVFRIHAIRLMHFLRDEGVRSG